MNSDGIIKTLLFFALAFGIGVIKVTVSFFVFHFVDTNEQISYLKVSNTFLGLFILSLAFFLILELRGRKWWVLLIFFLISLPLKWVFPLSIFEQISFREFPAIVALLVGISYLASMMAGVFFLSLILKPIIWSYEKLKSLSKNN